MALNFEAFIDDSARRPNGDFALGGHVATSESWAKFALKWKELLPSGTKAKTGNYHFKMSELAFIGAIERAEPFYRIIEDHVLVSVCCRMNLLDFKRAQEHLHQTAARLGVEIDLKNWANPYFFLFRGLIDNFHRQRKMMEDLIPLTETVDFYFDEQNEKRFILAAWDDYLDNQDAGIRDYFGKTPRFEDDQKFLPLQAADLWAWWVREWFEEDAHTPPDKMLSFDFRKWHGKKRPLMIFSYDNEHVIANEMMAVAMDNIGGATRGGEFILPE